jgi:hypothetical protein
VQQRFQQIALTVIGHLHSEFFFYPSRILAGMPSITFLGRAIERMSRALREAKKWSPFHVRLCPALGGIDLLRDGGFLEVNLPREKSTGLVIKRHRFPKHSHRTG